MHIFNRLEEVLFMLFSSCRWDYLWFI